MGMRIELRKTDGATASTSGLKKLGRSKADACAKIDALVAGVHQNGDFDPGVLYSQPASVISVSQNHAFPPDR